MKINLKREQLDSMPPELRDALANGPVTVELERAVWEPKGGGYFVTGNGGICNTTAEYMEEARYGSQRQTRAAAGRLHHDDRQYRRLHAWREEHCPGYVVPPSGEQVWVPMINHHGKWVPQRTSFRLPVSIEMPEDACLKLCDALNSGEVVL
jgi:hypothetical protein